MFRKLKITFMFAVFKLPHPNILLTIKEDFMPWVSEVFHNSAANIYLLKVNNRNTRTRCERYLKVTIF